ncbi:hypothetical protein ACFWBF_32140 [Streptomyces sp. NPDC060028]|uniref:hypothetical protein n=1 Tax=Streptomyces sp. NPDC060028 TaxID=3347041 RepID=UPI0036B89FCA
MTPGSEAVGAYQMLTAWAVLVVTQQPSERSLALIGIGSVAAVAVGFLHGMLLVKPLALLGRWTARVTAWPRVVGVAASLAPLSAGVAGVAVWWLRSQSVVSSVGFLEVWALTAAAAVLPLVAGSALRERAVAARAVWRQGAVIAGGVVGVVTMMSFVMELPL